MYYIFYTYLYNYHYCFFFLLSYTFYLLSRVTCFHCEECDFSISRKLSLPAINFLSLSGLSVFFTYFWKIALLVIKFLISIFDSPLRIYYPTAFWPQLFSDEKIQLLHISGLPSMWYIVFLLLLSSISLCLTNFNYDVSHCECECFCIYHTWRLIGFLDMVIFFIKLRTFNYFFF